MAFDSAWLNNGQMETIADIRHANLLLLIAETGGVQRLADRMGKAQAQISQYKARSPLPSGKLRAIGDAFAREAELACGKPPGWMDTSPANRALGAAMRSGLPSTESDDDFVDVPILGTVDRGAVAEVEVPFYTGVAASAGHGASNGDSPHVKLRFRAESLRRKGIDPGGARLIYVRGDSMEPLMYDGDQIMFDATKRAIRDGELYVVRIDEDELVKRLHKRPGNRLVVQSENPAFAPFELDATSPGFAVLGQVVWRAGWM
jgi:phage repressor protein C with HTH and peptisase S24 domain